MTARRVLTLLLAALAAQGCASAGQSWRAGPGGIPYENQLRAQLVAGQFGSALESMKDRDVAPADALLRNLYKGLIAVHAGQNELGTRTLDRAWQIAYDRHTKRLSDGAQSLVTGDGALPYTVGPAERLFIPYYGGLNWLARNERLEAAVEARRMGMLLASDASNNPGARYMGVMRYVSGVMFEVAGERNDADVAYRNAAVLLDGQLPGDTLPPDAAHGDVVILIEDGFVARPEPAALDFWVNDDEVTALESREGTVSLDTYRRVDARRGVERDWRAEHYRNVSLRWPVMAPVNAAAGTGVMGARATLDSGVVVAGAVGVSVSDAVRADFEREQPGRIARAIARSAVRDVSARAAGGAFKAAGDVMASDEDDDSNGGKGEKGSKKDEDDDGKGKGWAAAGLILAGIGLLAIHVGSQVLDQPDLRAWQLLPDRVTVARMRLPVGEHVVEVTRDGEAYSLGTVTVQPGEVTVLVHRWWPNANHVVAMAPLRVGAASADAAAPPVPVPVRP